MLRTHSSGAFESKLKSNMAVSGLPRASYEEPCDTATANFLANKTLSSHSSTDNGRVSCLCHF